jgi:hypothetical protein
MPSLKRVCTWVPGDRPEVSEGPPGTPRYAEILSFKGAVLMGGEHRDDGAPLHVATTHTTEDYVTDMVTSVAALARALETHLEHLRGTKTAERAHKRQQLILSEVLALLTMVRDQTEPVNYAAIIPRRLSHRAIDDAERRTKEAAFVATGLTDASTPQERETRLAAKEGIIEMVLLEDYQGLRDELNTPRPRTPGGSMMALRDWPDVRDILDRCVAMSGAQDV